MQTRESYEERFVCYLKENFISKPPILGIGDDCAVIPKNKEEAWLVTTDALVEGVHFLKEEISATDLGYKSVAVSVSDTSSMGGEPLYAFLSIALPKTIDWNWAKEILQGIKAACAKWNILLLGGDTVGSKRDLFLSLTLIGSAPLHQIKYRHLAKPGDLIFTTGYLGDAGGGLKALQSKTFSSKHLEPLISAHFHPEPNPKQGQWLSCHPALHAMMDLSDGLHCDLTRLIQSSQLGATVEISQLPISTSLAQACKEYQWDSIQLALTGGEDYSLLCTCDPILFPSLQKDFQKQFSTPLFEIGRITSSDRGKIIYEKQGELIQLKTPYFDHFL